MVSRTETKKVYFVESFLRSLCFYQRFVIQFSSPRGSSCGCLGSCPPPEVGPVWPPEPPFWRRWTGENPGKAAASPELHTETSASRLSVRTPVSPLACQPVSLTDHQQLFTYHVLQRLPRSLQVIQVGNRLKCWVVQFLDRSSCQRPSSHLKQHLNAPFVSNLPYRNHTVCRL